MTGAGGPRPERLFSLFQELVRIDSEPRSEGKMCAFIKDFFTRVGLAVHEDGAAAGTGGECGNLVVRVPAGAFSPLPPVILNAHMDSVVPSRGAFARAAEEDGCGLEIEVDRAFEHFRLDSSSAPVRFLAAAIRECGLEPFTIASGGASDANVFNGAGLQVACMSIGLADAHSKEEYILKSEMEACARVVCTLAVLSASEGEAA